MLRGLKTLTEYIMSVARVFLVFVVALFLPWVFLYQVQTHNVDGKATVRIVQSDRFKERAHAFKEVHG